MTLHLTSGAARVLATGTVTTFFGHPLRLELVQPEGTLRVTLAFAGDDTTTGPRVTTTQEPEGWTFDLINFDGADGRGSSDPVLLGAVGPDLVFLHFRVFRYGQTPDHTVHYTFFRAPRSAVPTP